MEHTTANPVPETLRNRHRGMRGPVPALSMPAISIFFGIVIRMFYKEHDPPHFHAEYQGQRGKFDLNGSMMVGNIQSKTALRLIRQWAREHATELGQNWLRAKATEPLEAIEPLR